MNNYSVYFPAYTIGPQAYQHIPTICAAYGTKAVVIGGKKALKAAREKLIQGAGENIELLDFLEYGGECSYENVEKLQQHPAVQKAEMIFAVGGGKALDTGKCLAEKLQRPVFTFPTIASTCAACTAVSIIYDVEGRFKEPFFFEKPARHAFIDTEILAQSPERYMWAGLGDTYAKYFEATVSSRGEQLPHYVALGVTMSSMCMHPLLQYGRQAMEDQKKHQVSEALEQTVLAVIVTTAIVSTLVTKEHIIDYNTGLAHAVFYALTTFPHLKIEQNHLHGEVVALGVLILLLVDAQKEAFETMFAFHQAVGLPTCLEDIGVTAADLPALIPQIVQMPDISHNPYPITETMLQEAFAALQNDPRNKK